MILALAAAVVLVVATALSAVAHVPPDTGPGGQTECVSDSTHDSPEAGLEVAADAPGNDCGERP